MPELGPSVPSEKGERGSAGYRLGDVRSHFETIMEIAQIKGDSETRPVLSPRGELDDLETWNDWGGPPAQGFAPDIARIGYSRGVPMEGRKAARSSSSGDRRQRAFPFYPAKAGNASTSLLQLGTSSLSPLLRNEQFVQIHQGLAQGEYGNIVHIERR